jgi:hypothetical protein
MDGVRSLLGVDPAIRPMNHFAKLPDGAQGFSPRKDAV